MPDHEVSTMLDTDALSTRIAEVVRAAVAEAIDDSALARQGAMRERLGFSLDVIGLTHLLAARSNDSQDNTLQKALTLYGLALDALEKGNKLAIITANDEIVHDVIGFNSVGPIFDPATK